MTAMTPAQVTPTREQCIEWLTKAIEGMRPGKHRDMSDAILSLLRSQAAPSDARRVGLSEAQREASVNGAVWLSRIATDPSHGWNLTNADRSAMHEYSATLRALATSSAEPSKAVCARCNNERIVRNSREEAEVVGEEWSECPDCQPPSPATALVSALVDAGEAGELDDDAIDADNERMLAERAVEPPSPAAGEVIRERAKEDWTYPFAFLQLVESAMPADDFAPGLEGIEMALLGYEKATGIRLRVPAEHPHASPGDAT